MTDVISLPFLYTRTMPTAGHHRSRVITTTLVAAAHGYLALIGFTGLLNYTVPTKYEFLEEVAAEPYWSWTHLICGTVILASLIAPTYRPKIGPWTSELPLAALACALGFALLTSWALFNLLWGLSAVRPVSLAGPGMALVVALGEQLLAHAWTRGTYDKGR